MWKLSSFPIDSEKHSLRLSALKGVNWKASDSFKYDNINAFSFIHEMNGMLTR